MEAWFCTPIAGRAAEPPSVEAAQRRTERFGLIDSQLEADASIPLGKRWRAETELAKGSTSQVLARWRWRARLWLRDAAGGDLAAGVGRKVRTGAIVASAPGAPGWAASVARCDHRQSDLYGRRGGRLGVRH